MFIFFSGKKRPTWKKVKKPLSDTKIFDISAHLSDLYLSDDELEDPELDEIFEADEVSGTAPVATKQHFDGNDTSWFDGDEVEVEEEQEEVKEQGNEDA